MKIHLPKYSNIKWLVASGLFVIALFLSGTAVAQTVSGTVTDEVTGDPLPGVNISIEGTTSGTTTDAEGRYELDVPSLEETLQFTFIGYESISEPIDNRTTIDVQMQTTTVSGEEVVVMGYSTQEQRDLTGSVSVVDVDDFKASSTGQISKQLQGKASGVTVVSSGQPGESPNVRIRGINTFGNNNPLYVVDGVPTQDIDDLNPNDIASMQVLKDAAAASIYGSRAANGVIVITTEQGGGEVQIDYKGTYGWEVPPSGNVWDILSPQEMAELDYRARRTTDSGFGGTEQYGDDPNNPELPYYILPAGAGQDEVNEGNYFLTPEYNDPDVMGSFNQIIRANQQGTDWFDEIFDPAGAMNHDLKVSGGGDIGNYLFSFNYLDQKGTLMESFRTRYSLRANTRFNVGDNIRIGENLTYTVSENPQIAALTEGSAIGMSYRQQPIIPVRDVGGNFAGTQAPNLGNAQNPVAMQHRIRNNEGTNTRLFGNAFMEMDLVEHFTVRTTFGGSINSGTDRSFSYPTYENAENTTNNSFSANSWYGQNWTWTNTLNYQDSFQDIHNIEVTLGTEAYRNSGQNVGGTTQDYFSFNPDYTNLSTGSGDQTNYSETYEDALFSYFGRLDYDFEDKYILSATIRRDGSSRFLNNRWGWFPAGSLGWRISQENFMQEVDWMSDLKIRVGYGIMGNQLNVDPSNPYTLYSGDIYSSYYAIDGSNSSTQQGFEQSRIGNPDAEWEKNINANIGVDAMLFEERLEISAEYYWKDVQDLLYNPELQGTAGAADPPFVNVANMRNSGFDANVATYGSIGEDLEYNVSATFTSYSNEIHQIAEGIDYFSQEARRFTGSSIIRNEVGQPVSSYYGYQIEGFWNSEQEIEDADNNAPSGEYQDEAGIGRFRYADVDGDGEITPDDRTFLGDPNPDFTYGINLGLNYQNFDFSMFLYGSQGADIWNQVKYWTDFYTSFTGAKSHTALHDSWTEDNQDATVAIQENEGTFSTNSVPNSYYVEDGSYLRLQNLQLGYTIPGDILERTGIRDLRIYVQGENLLTLTGYSGLDPEVGFSEDGGGGSTNFGIDEGSYPRARQFLIGVELSY